MEEETAAVVICYFLVWMVQGRVRVTVGGGQKGAGTATEGAE